MINRVVLTGRLTRDPELRTTGSGIAVATFTIAVDRRFKTADGNRGADFISCVIWRKPAENFCNHTRKGSFIGIDGRIQTRNYDNKDGQKVYVTEVVVDNFTFLESRKQEEERANGNYGQYNSDNANNGNYTNNANNSNNGYNANNNANGGYSNNGQGTGATTNATASNTNTVNGTKHGTSATTTTTTVEDPFKGDGDTLTLTKDDIPF